MPAFERLRGVVEPEPLSCASPQKVTNWTASVTQTDSTGSTGEANLSRVDQSIGSKEPNTP